MNRYPLYVLVIAISAPAAIAAGNENQLANDARRAYENVKDYILRSAGKMPESSYSFKPAPRVRTFGQILGHIAEEQYIFCGAAKGEEKAADVEKTKTSKSDLLAALHDSFAYCDEVYESLTDATGSAMIQRGQSRRTRFSLLWGNTIHDNQHYGNLVTYLRINGIVPPSTEGQ